MTGGSFEVLCPDSASDISRGVFPTAAATKEHKAWNGGSGGKRKHHSANFLLPEQFFHELMCCKVPLPPTFSWQSSFTARLLGFRSYNRQEQKNWMFQVAIHQHNSQLNLCLSLMWFHNTSGSVSIQQMPAVLYSFRLLFDSFLKESSFRKHHNMLLSSSENTAFSQNTACISKSKHIHGVGRKREQTGWKIRADNAISEMMVRNLLTLWPCCVSQTKIRTRAHMNLPCGRCQLNEYTATKREATMWSPADKIFCSPAEKQELQTRSCWEQTSAAFYRSLVPRTAVWKEISASNYWQYLQCYSQSKEDAQSRRGGMK